MSGILYVVATPIGNMEDITDRAKRILSDVDIIAAEDTRNTIGLLRRLGINNNLVANHKFNERHQCDYLISQLLEGKNIAVVSDAGTPCISDPGSIIVEAAVKNNIQVIGVCGASAVITGISISGFSALSFAFYGFFPKTNHEIREKIEQVKENGIPVSVFYESPLRIKKTINLLCELLADSEMCLCNDMTKMYERVYRGTPQSILEELKKNPSSEKGEYTLIIKTNVVRKIIAQSDSTASLESQIVDYMITHKATAKQAVKELSKKSGMTKNDLYTASLHLKEMFTKSPNKSDCEDDINE